MLIVLWMYLRFLGSSAMSLSFDISASPSTTVNIGGNITITSVIHNPMSVSWRAHAFGIHNGIKDDSCFTVQYTSNSKCIAVAGFCPEFTFDCDFTKFNLHIYNAHRNISGYTIRSIIYFNSGNPIETRALPIRVKVPLQNVSLIPNGTVTLHVQEIKVFKCSARSLPIPSLHWTIDRSTPTTSASPFPSGADDFRTSEVTYVAQKTDNKKSLVCTANNGGSDVTAIALFDIQYAPTVTITTNHGTSPHSVLENYTNLQLVCNGSDSNPAPNVYRWYKDGEETYLGQLEVYTIKPVKRSHAGNYTCDATNNVGQSNLSEALSINVLYGVSLYPIAKQQPIDGKILSVSCNGLSNPVLDDIDVTWSKQGNITFTQKGRQLLIPNINRNDSGVYICNVIKTLIPSNGPEINVTGTTSVEIDVLYLPTVVIHPEIRHYNVLENYTNLQLVCNGKDSNPAPTLYTWYNDDTWSNSEPEYLIPVVSRSDAGNYTCDAKNIVGTSARSAGIIINVLYGVSLYSITKQQPADGTKFSVFCNGTSNPELDDNDVTWTKQGNITFTQRGRQLLIQNINRKDSGIYICNVFKTLVPNIGSAVNVTETASVVLEVLYRPTVKISTESPIKDQYTVVENSTNIQITCIVTDTNTPVNSYKWFKDGSDISVSTANYTISHILQSHDGNYTCTATNMIGSSDPSTELKLNVLYGVSLTIGKNTIFVNETTRWNITCYATGNPLPALTWKYVYNDSAFDEPFSGDTYTIEVEHANCRDTGIYKCLGSNIVRNDSVSVSVSVACSPRYSKVIQSKDVYINRRNDSLNITATFISYPTSVIKWFRKQHDGNVTEISKGFKISSYTSVYPFESISNLYKDVLIDSEFGDYIVNASNAYGSSLFIYHVKAKRIPDRPVIVSVSCNQPGQSTVIWKGGFNGGQLQHFEIWYSVSTPDSNKMYDVIVNETDLSEYRFTLTGLESDMLHYFTLHAVNNQGYNEADYPRSCMIIGTQTTKTSAALILGISGSITTVVLVIIITAVYIIRKQRTNTTDKHTKTLNESDRRAIADEKVDTDLKDNILYISADEIKSDRASNNSCTVKLSRDVYATVMKSQAEKTSSKGLDLYENFEMPVSNFPQCLNGQNEKRVKKSTALNCNQHLKKTNKDGLVYADLELSNSGKSEKFVIRGLESRSIYADIDVSRTAEPLQSDESDTDPIDTSAKDTQEA